MAENPRDIDPRAGWLGSSFATLAIVSLIVASGFAWRLAQREPGRGGRTQANTEAVGTSGELPREKSPVGFDPDAPVGDRVSFVNVIVDRTEDGGTFWIRDGEAMIRVVAPGGTPTVRAGQRVNVSGTVEAAGLGKQIRASRIDVK